MRVVDVHGHCCPPGYVDALRAGERAITVKVDAAGNPEVHCHWPLCEAAESLGVFLRIHSTNQIGTIRSMLDVVGGKATTLLGLA